MDHDWLRRLPPVHQVVKGEHDPLHDLSIVIGKVALVPATAEDVVDQLVGALQPLIPPNGVQILD